MPLPKYWLGVFLAAAIPALPTVAQENSQILPQGRFSLGVKYLGGRVQDRWTTDGNREPLAQPVNRAVTFRRLAKHKSSFERTKIQAFLATQGWSMEDEVGRYQADMDAQVQATALVLGYGLTSKTSVAIGVPVIRAHTRVKVGFQSGLRGRQFVAQLADPGVNLGGEAARAAAELTDAVAELDANLTDYGYAPLTNWQDQGVGDIQLGMKHQWHRDAAQTAAVLAGVVLPTGRTDDPDLLTDVPFGDGGFDLFAGLAWDTQQNRYWNSFLFGKWIHQLPFKKTVRLTTAEETVFAGKTQAEFKPGDVVQGGTGTRLQAANGVGLGGGLLAERRFGDTYRNLPGDSKRYHEGETDSVVYNAMAEVGYDSTTQFLQGKSQFPLITKASYLYQLYGEQVAKANTWQVDINVFF